MVAIASPARARGAWPLVVLALTLLMGGCDGESHINPVGFAPTGPTGPEYIIGNDTPGGNLGFGQDLLTGQAFTVSTDTNVVRLGIISVGGGVNYQMGVYTDSGAVPFARVVSSAAGTLTGGSQEINVAPTPLAAGTYWIMFVMGGVTSIGDTGGSFPREAVAHTFGVPLPGLLSTSPGVARDLNLWMVVQDD